MAFDSHLPAYVPLKWGSSLGIKYTSRFNCFILDRSASSFDAGVMVSVPIVSSVSVVVLMARAVLDFEKRRDKKPPWTSQEFLAKELVIGGTGLEDEDTKAADGDEANANKAVTATWRSRWWWFCFRAARRGIMVNIDETKLFVAQRLYLLLTDPP